MSYQVRIEFPASSIEDYDNLIELETALISKLAPHHDVDGHEVGLGNFTLFIGTNYPENLLKMLLDSELSQIAKLASLISYRHLNSEKTITLWKKT